MQNPSDPVSPGVPGDASKRALSLLPNPEERIPSNRFLPVDSGECLVGGSASIAAVRDAIARLAPVDSTVLLTGETGTGKSLVARLIHRASPRCEHPFVVVDCSAPGTDLLEAELFGLERLSSVVASGRGRIEEAQGGTLVLEEVGDLPQAIQPRVQRFLQTRSVRRVGGSRERAVDVRVVATSQRNLLESVAAGRFRPDLYYRLAAVPVDLPPLRNRLDDVAALAAHAAARSSERLGRPVRPLAAAALGVLQRYAFPGNVRELENVVERALVLGDDRAASVELGDLPEHVRHPLPIATSPVPMEKGFVVLRELQEQLERDLVLRAIRRWPELSNTEIADRLGTNRRVFELRLKQYGLSKRVRKGPTVSNASGV
ncbi:MAG: sigma 54-interacting transcriptional regulator [Vicinamibacterales bacterium]